MNGFIAAVWRLIDLPFKFAAVLLITIYRYTLSAFVGRIWKFGFWPGGWMGLARFVRCRPGGTDGYDPVPEAMPERACWYRPWTYGRWK